METCKATKKTGKAMDEDGIIRQISLVGIIGNILLCTFKMYAGIVGKSGAMISDALHSLSDVFATFIAFLGVKFSKKEADKSHPYGHERMECLASILLGIILLVTGIGIGKVGTGNIIAGDYENLAIPGAIALAAAVVSIIVKEAMFWYTRHYAKVLDSPAFMADAWHHRSDAFSSIGSLIGIAGARLGFPVLDSVASVVICLLILKVAIDILIDAVKKMLDTSCGEEFEKDLKMCVTKQQGVLGIDMLHTRMFGNKVYVDLEIQVQGEKTVYEAHKIAEDVHDAVEKVFPDVKHIMVHVNPAA